MIPVDFVCNATIVSTYFQLNKPGLTVVQSCSSEVNPCTASNFLESGYKFLKYQPFKEQIAPLSISWIKNKKLFRAKYFIERELPIKIFDRISKIPGIGTPQIKKYAKMANLLNEKTLELFEIFGHFIINEWIYESKMIYKFIS